jgi:hypothetical protein
LNLEAIQAEADRYLPAEQTGPGNVVVLPLYNNLYAWRLEFDPPTNTESDAEFLRASVEACAVATELARRGATVHAVLLDQIRLFWKWRAGRDDSRNLRDQWAREHLSDRGAIRYTLTLGDPPPEQRFPTDVLALFGDDGPPIGWVKYAPAA